MNVRSKLLKGSLALGFGQFASYGCSFVRNMILARMLTKADFGIAAVCSVIISLLEFTGKMGVARAIVQDKRGEDIQFLASAHFVQFTAGLVSSILIFALATPLAAFFGLHGLTWLIRALALMPLMNGACHLDNARYTRELAFWPNVICETVPQMIMTIAAWPMAHWLGDYRAVLALTFAKGIMTCTLTHIVASTPYRWRTDRSDLQTIFKFTWPLLLNGFLIFGIQQGDQAVVGRYYSMSDLGVYAAAASLTFGIGVIFNTMLGQLLIPLLAKKQDDPQAFGTLYRRAIQLVAALSSTYALVLIIAGEALMVLIFGKKFAGGGTILAWMAGANAFRMLRIAPTMAALAKADSKNMLYCNLLRGVGFIPAFAAAWSGYPLWMVAGSGLVGESLAFFGSFSLLQRRDKVPHRWSMVPAAMSAAAIMLAGVGVFFGMHHLGNVVALVTAFCIAGTIGCLILAAFEESRAELGRARRLVSGLFRKTGSSTAVVS